MPQTYERLHWLDAFRGIAACLVMFSHVASLNWVPWDDRSPSLAEHALFMLGSPSVDVFFVLSGFVIARALLNKPLTLLSYFQWRFIRIMPIAWCGVMLGWLVKTIVLFNNPNSNSVWHSIGTPLTSLDWLGFVTLFYPLSFDHAKINMALWSLQAEVLFICIFPLVFSAMRRHPWLIFGLLWLTSLPLALITSSMSFLCLPLFFLGVAAAIKSIHFLSAPKLLFLGCCWMLVSNIVVDNNINDGGIGFIKRYIDMWGALMIVMTLTQYHEPPPKILSFFGKISFSLYIIHLPILTLTAWLAKVLFGWNYWIGGIIGIPVAVISAYLMHKHIESKFIELSRQSKRHAS